MTPELRAALATGNTLQPAAAAGKPRSRARGDRQASTARPAASASFPAPSNPVRCSDALLVACEEMAESLDTGVHCHLLETRTQAELAARAYGRTHGRAHGARSARSAAAGAARTATGSRTPRSPSWRKLGAVAVLNPEVQSQDRLRHAADPGAARGRRALRARHRRGEHQRQPDPAGRHAARRDPASRRRAGPAALGDGRRRDRDGDHRRREGDAASRSSAGSCRARRRISCCTILRRRGGCR